MHSKPAMSNQLKQSGKLIAIAGSVTEKGDSKANIASKDPHLTSTVAKKKKHIPLDSKLAQIVNLELGSAPATNAEDKQTPNDSGSESSKIDEASLKSETSLKEDQPAVGETHPKVVATAKAQVDTDISRLALLARQQEQQQLAREQEYMALQQYASNMAQVRRMQAEALLQQRNLSLQNELDYINLLRYRNNLAQLPLGLPSLNLQSHSLMGLNATVNQMPLPQKKRTYLGSVAVGAAPSSQNETVPTVGEGNKRIKVTPPGMQSQSISQDERRKEDEDDSGRRFRHYQSEQWTEKFQELRDFRKQRGHCQVPHSFDENPALARWVKRQRYQYKLRSEGKTSTMTEERIILLEKIGFIWDSHAAGWAEKLHELQSYAKAHGNCDVPSTYPINPQLATWVKCQRRQYKLMRAGKGNNMTKQRVLELEKIGFKWEVRRTWD